MKYVNAFFLSLILTVLIACGGGSSNQESTKSGTGEESSISGCQTEADCVPASCCHPKECILASNAPDCEEAMCTTDCKEGTMDCGKGTCSCVQGACTVKWAN